MVEFINVTKSYPNGNVVIDNLSLKIKPGEFVVLTGKSGAGKTTFGRLLIRDIVPTSGSIIVDGEDITQIKSNLIPQYRRKIGIIFQDYKIIQDKTVGENLSLALDIAGYSSSQIPEKVTRLLEMVDIPDKEDLFPTQLSGGELQRAAIARAIAADPSIVFADEPTGNLDVDTSLEIFKLLQKINKAGTTIIMATHDVTLIDMHEARHIHMEKGKLIHDSEKDGVKKEIEERRRHKASSNKEK